MKEIQGDLIKESSNYDIIVHGCNCQNNFGAGFAKSVAKKWPGAAEIDAVTVKGDRDKLGRLTSYWSGNPAEPTIVNAYTQFRYGYGGPHLDMEALRSCMKKVKQQYTGKRIAMPRIGAGLAGGDWDKIKALIEEELVDEDVTILVFNQ